MSKRTELAGLYLGIGPSGPVQLPANFFRDEDLGVALAVALAGDGAERHLRVADAILATEGGQRYADSILGTFTFTQVNLNTETPVNSVVGTFYAVSPGGYPVTITMTDPDFNLAGTSLLTVYPLQKGTYEIEAIADDGHGWMYPQTFELLVASAEALVDVAFSKDLFVGVPLSGVVIDGVPLSATIVTNVPGVILDQTTRPVLASGTPTVESEFSNGLVQTKDGITRNSTVKVKSGIPVNTMPPTVEGVPQVGVAYGGSNGTWTNAGSGIQFFYQWFLVTEGGSAAGVAIPASKGGALEFYTPTATDAQGGNKRLRKRVRAATPAGPSVAPGIMSDPSPFIIPPAVVSTAPVFTADPVATSAMTIEKGGSGIGDVITVGGYEVTGASGPPVITLLLDGAAAGEATSFEREMVHLTTDVSYQVTYKNAAGEPTSAYTNVVPGDPGIKNWPPCLVNPVEKIELGVWSQPKDFLYDDDLDALVVAGVHVPQSLTKVLKLLGGRNRWVRGITANNNELSIYHGTGRWSLEGHSFNGAASEGDGFVFGGLITNVPDSGVVSNSRFENSHGTANAFFYNGVPNKQAIDLFERTGTDAFRLVLKDTSATGGTKGFVEPVTPTTQILYGPDLDKPRRIRIGAIPGVAPLQGFHHDYEITKIVSATEFLLKKTTFPFGYWDEFPRPPVGITGRVSSGTAWFMWWQAGARRSADNAQHADSMGQQEANKPMTFIKFERCTSKGGNYQSIIAGNPASPVNFPGPLVELEDCNMEHGLQIDPQEINTLHMYLIKVDQLRAKNTWMKARYNRSVRTSSVFWGQAGKTSANRTWTESIVNGRKLVTTAGMEGEFIDGIPEVDFCARTGGAYQAPGYLGYSGPSISRFTRVGLEETSVADPGVGEVLTLLDIEYDGPEIIDATISGVNPNIISMGIGRRLIRGASAVKGVTYNFMVVPAVRGATGVNKPTNVSLVMN